MNPLIGPQERDWFLKQQFKCIFMRFASQVTKQNSGVCFLVYLTNTWSNKRLVSKISYIATGHCYSYKMVAMTFDIEVFTYSVADHSK